MNSIKPQKHESRNISFINGSCKKGDLKENNLDNQTQQVHILVCHVAGPCSDLSDIYYAVDI